MTITSEADIWPHLMLRNAIIEQAVYDFEMLISDAPLPIGADSCSKEMTIPAIRAFAKGTKVDVWLDKIYRIYNEEFRPYVLDNMEKIIADWDETKKAQTRYGLEKAYKQNPNKCPLCGGVLKPKTVCGVKVIGCTGCYLNVTQYRRNWKCSTSDAIPVEKAGYAYLKTTK